MENNCLNCHYLSEPDQPHKWHECLYEMVYPKAMQGSISEQLVNILNPFTNCLVFCVKSRLFGLQCRISGLAMPKIIHQKSDFSVDIPRWNPLS